jgi:RimJ/RimL family protein N-acetyltransferase
LRQGVGLGMIGFANQKVGLLLRAGTQSINKASINLYQKAGFILEKTQFVLHKHVREVTAP